MLWEDQPLAVQTLPYSANSMVEFVHVGSSLEAVAMTFAFVVLPASVAPAFVVFAFAAVAWLLGLEIVADSTAFAGNFTRQIK